MKIVLDSTVIISNFFMSGPTFRLFKWFIDIHNPKLIVPQIVLEEVKNKYREIAHSKISSVLSSIDNINSHLQIDIETSFNIGDLDDKCSHYNQLLDDALSSINANIISYDHIPQSDIVDRDLSRKRPFRKVGKDNKFSTGYRDTLIWEIILRNVVADTNLVVFISNNKSDFCEKGSTALHKHLREDLSRLDLPGDRVKICESIDSFVDGHVKHLLPVLKDVADELKENKFEDFSVLEWFKGNLDKISKWMERKIDLPLELFTHFEIDPLTISSIEDPTELSIIDVYAINDESVYIEFEIKAFFSLDFYVHNYYLVHDMHKLPLDISVEEHDNYGAWITANLELPIECALTYNILDKTVEDFEGSFKEIFGWCPYCGEPITHDAAESCYKCNKRFF